VSKAIAAYAALHLTTPPYIKVVYNHPEQPLHTNIIERCNEFVVARCSTHAAGQYQKVYASSLFLAQKATWSSHPSFSTTWDLDAISP